MHPKKTRIPTTAHRLQIYHKHLFEALVFPNLREMEILVDD